MKSIIQILLKNKKAQAMLFLLVAVVIADAGFYMLRTSPASSGAAAMEGELRQNRVALRKMQAEYRLYESFDKGRSDLDKFKGLLPRRAEYIEVIKKVYRLAKEDGMKGSSFGTEEKEVEQEGDLVQLNFSLPVKGNYKNVRKFVYDVETSPLFLNIDHLALNADVGGGDINVTIALSTYVRS
jgi:Tfp pilus assembly protein PilO